MSPAARHPVSHQASESLIAAVELRAAGPDLGIFGPASVSWRVNRESALFLGAGRAALLQLAHPWVATALQQHSDLLQKPIRRFHNTFRIVFTMIFGSLQQATAAARHLYELHTHIQGQMSESVAQWPSGSHYQANEIAALRWVYATLIESAVLAYEAVLPPLLPEEIAAYYAESKTMAALFGLPAEALPPDWPAFLAYCRSMEQSSELGVSDAARKMAHAILAGAGSWIKPPRWYRALTTQWLPPRFREEFHLRLDPSGQRALQNARRWFPSVYSVLPGPIRFVGPYQQALRRLAGHAPGPLTRASNRFWIGQAKLPFEP